LPKIVDFVTSPIELSEVDGATIPLRARRLCEGLDCVRSSANWWPKLGLMRSFP